MALPTYYDTGTATLAAGGVAVTGTSTQWLNTVQPGDLFTDGSGLYARIASVASNTSLTLAKPWPGDALAAAAYEIQLLPRSVGVQEATRRLLEQLSNGNLTEFAGLEGAADKLGYFDGPGSMALTSITAAARELLAYAGAADKMAYYDAVGSIAIANLSAHGRAVLGLSGGAGKFVRSTGANSAVMQDIIGSVTQSGGTPTGALFEYGSNANGEYARFASGLQICVMTGPGQLCQTAIGVLFASDNVTVNYPTAFVAPPACTVTPKNVQRIGCASGSATSVTVRQWQSASNGALIESNIMAIGRWF